ncbi:MAG: acyl-CoA dehydrogenase family protein [Candidatus Eisenbacteria bacterium]|uniref:Acyl-CoA dehydrogenase family protein n=1 Tax=Eiseniibacteriota bacterium TaxID=2212470 RepID=A0A956NAL3_UNCEI|nr:acyl-CoA dehydrogenase family protein [Candidatus Eisenbacteria bacterium]MCB9464857.1 acyl-CoA dehydrogenase family protein [Candidatus Eisenbacteria bacterium]
MDFSLTEEQQMIRDTAREFADKELVPNAPHWDQNREFPVEAVKKLGELGFLGMMVSPDWDGSGMDSISYALAIEEISRGCASTGVIMSVNNSLVCDPLERFGTDHQKETFLKPLASGAKLGSYCLTEPMAGSDAGATKTTAVKDGDDWIVNGVKIFVTNGAYADTFVVYASTDPAQKTRGISAFIIEKERDGVSVGTREKTLGIRASCTSEIIFDNVRVPDANRLGDLGKGFKVAMITLNGGRIGIAAQAVGIAQAAFERSIEYTKTRHQFDQPIAEFQAVQFKIADMATKIDAARLLTLEAAHQKDLGQDYSMAAAKAKLLASRVAVEVADDAIQVHGGYGYVEEYHVERHFRDAKITELYEGTSEIQRIVIGRGVTK